MSSTSQHAHAHSISSAQRASLPPSHSREYSGSHRPGSSMSISSMLGTDTDVSRNRPSLPPPLPAPQSSPTTNGNGHQDTFRRAYSVIPPRSYIGPHPEHQQFGPPLPSASNQSSPYRPNHAESTSPTHPSYDYRRNNVPPHESQRAVIQDGPPRGISSWQSYDMTQESRYSNEPRNSRPSEQRDSPSHSPIKQSRERDESGYSFLPKPITSSIPPTNTPQTQPERQTYQRAYDPRGDRQSSSPELSRHHRENGLRSLQEIRRDSAGTPDPLSTPRSSPLLRRSFAVGAPGSEDNADRRVMDILADDKRGRASPLPQAVQGAQAQAKGPTNEPGIKNEFARMFSGIGSGVGSAVSTPVPQAAQLVGSVPLSPLDVDGRGTPLGKRVSHDSRVRDSSRATKRRRVMDDDIKREEDASVSLARTLSGRGQKRTRNNYQNVSTPQAQPHHHHHHHHHYPADSGNLRKPSTPTPMNPAVVPHHHHHRHHHHHHNTTTRPAPAQVRRPQILINSVAVFEQAKHQPRSHLGSMLYQTKISAPTGEPGEVAKFGFVSTPTPIPKFEDKDNCTFTVRVPRTFLQKSALEEICERRFLWGAEVYTDDSDPIAVAIHSGWLRGGWDDDTDLSMLNAGNLDEAKAQAAELGDSKKPVISITKVPTTPMLPVPGRDLQITLLLLPRLEKYGSQAAHGIKSREWKGNHHHDGVSFKILKMAWTDEGLSRGEERGGEARRKRLNLLMNSDQEIGPYSKISTAFATGRDTAASKSEETVKDTVPAA